MPPGDTRFPRMTDSDLEKSYSLFPSGYATTFRSALSLKPYALPRLVDFVLSRMLSDEAVEGGTLVDFKGWGDGSRAGADELLSLSGAVVPSCEEDSEDPFFLRITTVFERFIGTGNIGHRAVVDRKGGVFEVVSTRDIARAFPVEIRSFRMGIDIFETSFIGSFFGFAPVVKKSFRVEAGMEALKLTVCVEGVKDWRLPPFDLHPMLRKICEIIEEVTAGDLEREYLRAVGGPS